MKNRKKNNYNNSNKTELKDIIQCQRIIPDARAKPRGITLCIIQ